MGSLFLEMAVEVRAAHHYYIQTNASHTDTQAL